MSRTDTYNRAHARSAGVRRTRIRLRDRSAALGDVSSKRELADSRY
jgi:hypothetical protein